MPLALRETPGTKMQTMRSAWTPLNHHLSNSHVFEERRSLLGKWFDKWTDSQRKQILQDFISCCSQAQLKYLRQNLCTLVPEEALDFTSIFPRVVSLYVFSFLDPRSLCRCAQVCWKWKNIVELDQLWMPKCLRLGWCITFAPTPFEQGVWKRHYVETVKALHISRPEMPVKEKFIVPEVRVIGSEAEESELGHGSLSRQGRSSAGRRSGTSAKGLPPWRDSDRHPTDTMRFNYLENLDPIEHARQAQTRSSRANSHSTTEENNKKKALSASSYRLRKAKSLIYLSLDVAEGKRRQSRPQWATQSFSAIKDPEKRLGSSQWNAGIRPSPVRLSVYKLNKEELQASQRSQTNAPMPLFEGQP